MSQTLDQSEQTMLRRELDQNGPLLIRVGTGLSILPLSSFAAVDPQVVAGDDLVASLLVRLISCSLLAMLFVASFFGQWAVRFAREGGWLVAFITGQTLVAVTYFTGGGESDYHEALHIAMFGFAMLPISWRPFDIPMLCVSYLGAYAAVLVIGDRTGPFGALVTHVGVLLASGVISSVLQVVLMKQRLRDFRSRQALASANERLKSLDAAKNHFFSNISHELRTPLTLIVAPLEALIESSREPLSAGQRERLQLAQRNALRLLRLVDDLLSLTKAEAASLKLHVSQFDLGRHVSAFTHDVSELAARKNISVSLEVPADPVTIEGDTTLIERILLNVFGNAAKFVAIGGHIALKVHEVDGGVEIAVSDNGVGIAEAHLPNIFDRFYQAESGNTRTTGGTGIGLSLVKEITELHGGRVTAESTLGVGTTIRCWFPLRLPPEAEKYAIRTVDPGVEPQGLPEWHQAIRTAKSYRLQGIDDATERRVAPRPRPRGDAPTILVVEDNPDMIRFLVALLAYEYNVLSAQDGKAGLKMSLERLPDLIISDVMMPEMDGFEMVRRLREDEHGKRIPLIFLTARGSSEDRIQGHSGGADTYLSKPFRSEELLAAVDALLTRQKSVLDSASSREDEALVYMASGVHERLSATTSELKEIQATLARLSDRRSPDSTRDNEPLSLLPMDPLPRLASSLASLSELIGSLRGLSEAGARPVIHPVDVDDALRGVVAGLEERVRTGRTLHLELGARQVVNLAEAEVRAIAEPLIMRALTVTPMGRNVFIQTQRKKGSIDEEAGVTLVIRDEGPSLSPDQIERLFFPFTVVDAELPDGLELARVRRLVLTRGGVISVEPEEELGSRIVIHLPILAPHAAEVAA